MKPPSSSRRDPHPTFSFRTRRHRSPRPRAHVHCECHCDGSRLEDLADRGDPGCGRARAARGRAVPDNPGVSDRQRQRLRWPLGSHDGWSLDVMELRTQPARSGDLTTAPVATGAALCLEPPRRRLGRSGSTVQPQIEIDDVAGPNIEGAATLTAHVNFLDVLTSHSARPSSSGWPRHRPVRRPRQCVARRHPRDTRLRPLRDRGSKHRQPDTHAKRPLYRARIVAHVHRGLKQRRTTSHHLATSGSGNW